MIRPFLILLIGLAVISCYEKINLAVEDQDFLVVSALLTDQDTIQTIQFSKTNPSGIIDVIDLAQVEVISSDSTLSEFEFDSQSGKYFYAGAFSTNERHKLRIKYNGNSYESSWESFDEGPIMQKLGVGITTIVSITDTGNEQETDLIQLKLHIAGSDEYYTMYHLSGIYEVTSIPRLEELRDSATCWIRDERNDFLNVQSGKGESSFVLETTSNGYRFSKYNLIVTQYGINKQAFDYWALNQELRNTDGGLYDPIPDEIDGNIRNLNDNQEIVIGYFTLGSQTSRRFAFGHADIPLNSRVYCFNEFGGYSSDLLCRSCLESGASIAVAIPPMGWIEP